MRTRADNFLSPLFGNTEGFVRIVIAQRPILSQEKVHGLGYMSVTRANGNLP
jgi:hypothetical protein